MYDAIVVGAGPAGAAVTWKLSVAGYKVLCLEQGEYVNYEKLAEEFPDWETHRLSDRNVNPNIRKQSADYPVNNEDSPISVANFNGVGGSMLLYSGHFPRFHPSDFKTFSLDGVADDWPISYEDLEPYYNLNDSIMGVSGLSGDPAYPYIPNMQPPVPLGLLGEKLASGFNTLGWHWWPAYSAIITKDLPGRKACRNLGPCNSGCPVKAKSSPDLNYWPMAIESGATILTGCRVSKLITDDKGKLIGVNYFDKANCEVTVKARVVVLAANGVGTPRILLNSSSKIHPNGFANSSGMVGRNLMFHPYGYVEGEFEEILDSSIGPQGCVLLSQEFYETSVERDFKRGYTIQALRGSGPLETAVTGFKRGTIRWGSDHHLDFEKRFRRYANIVVITEDLPDPNNRVTLDPDLKDSNGIPAPKIHYTLSSNTKKMMAHGLNMGRKLLRTSGATKTVAHGPVRQAGWHLMGTARMGDNAKNSVVDRWGRSHDVENLFIADSSVFVTSAGVNPASTIQALALRIADGIEDYLRGEV